MPSTFERFIIPRTTARSQLTAHVPHVGALITPTPCLDNETYSPDLHGRGDIFPPS